MLNIQPPPGMKCRGRRPTQRATVRDWVPRSGSELLHDAAHIKEAQRILTHLRYSDSSESEATSDGESEDGFFAFGIGMGGSERMLDPNEPRWMRSLVPWSGLWC